ncbi:Eco57I restriction-modification methylase domain-containing protein [Sorangium sp. So ce1182]|uniref:Eco57I restriction-modification methylase domain-containing protein n=1 Tax=Sorangium sp. So ce1182 TaxID=3133334 RepID=UPI003F62742E
MAQLQAGIQAESDYRIPRGLNLRDEIGRYWRIAQAHWQDFATGRAAGADARLLAERFVLGLLRDSFGFSTLVAVPPIMIEERSYPIGFHGVGGRAPVVVAPAASGLDAPNPAFADDGRRRSAFGLAQEYLNADESALWGLCSDGLALRVLRDNGSLTRPAWIEADLGRIFGEQRYADFAALWLLVHESRFGGPDRAVSECAIETWRTKGREEGTKARARMREGVEAALLAFGQGFIDHPDNHALRTALHDGSLKPPAYFQQLLRLVYRLIFLLTAEEREVLHTLETPNPIKARYAEGYGLRRLRERSLRRNAHDRYSDLWEAMKIVFLGTARGEPRLGLPALGGLFDADQCPFLDGAKLENRVLLLAVFRLSWLQEQSGLARVNWRDMGPEELGSVYESLLELVPQVTQGGRTFAFAAGGETQGNARKTSGSYYTPDSLVEVLLDNALEPVISATIVESPGRSVEALLELTIVDPACGSGHFLLAAARRVAGHVARLETNGTPSAMDYSHALRRVVGRCIFGVDLNPMAVELCKVSLWMEAVEPGRPLSFLDSHIQHGNALLGTTPELMKKGIPNEAWEPIAGDDKKIASAIKKQNKKEQTALTLDLTVSPASTYVRLGQGARDVDEATDEELGDVESKERRWNELVASQAYDHERFIADLWCSAFVWRKVPGPLRELAPTHAAFSRLNANSRGASPELREEVDRLRSSYHFFHWHLAFPQVFARGGFDVVLGNPPWDHIELKEQEWFAARNPAIANAPNASARKRMIEALRATDPKLYGEFIQAVSAVDAENNLVRMSGRFPLCAQGRINTYALFAEHNRSVLSRKARAGFIVPTGIATDDTTKEYFKALVDSFELVAFYSFENEEKIFPDVHNQFKFALLTIDRSGRSPRVDLVFFARQAASLSDPNRHFSLTSADFAALNPNTYTCPTFRSRRDADINLAIYRRAGILWKEDDGNGNPWGLRFMQGIFNMATDSSLFRSKSELEAAGWRREGNKYVLESHRMIPLVEAKMLHHFDHRFGTYEGATQANLNKGFLPRLDVAAHADPYKIALPEYWVLEAEVEQRLSERWTRDWILGWRDIARSVDERTVIASLIPRLATGDTFLLAMPSVDPRLIAGLYANLCSFALDYAARQKVGGTHIKYNVFKQLPVLAPVVYTRQFFWSSNKPVRDWILPRVLELTFTAWDLEPFARDCGYEGSVFRWNPERRFVLRAELDAAFFHLYSLSREDTDYILETFNVVKKNEEKAHGEYRTKRAILEIYDALAEATRTRQPYRSPLFRESNEP